MIDEGLQFLTIIVVILILFWAFSYFIMVMRVNRELVQENWGLIQANRLSEQLIKTLTESLEVCRENE